MGWTLIITPAHARDAHALMLTVFEENHRAIAFYSKYGFVQISEYPFPAGNKIDRDLILRLIL